MPKIQELDAEIEFLSRQISELSHQLDSARTRRAATSIEAEKIKTELASLGRQREYSNSQRMGAQSEQVAADIGARKQRLMDLTGESFDN